MTNIALTLYHNVAKLFLEYHFQIFLVYKYLIMMLKKSYEVQKKIMDDILIFLFTLFDSKVDEST